MEPRLQQSSNNNTVIYVLLAVFGVLGLACAGFVMCFGFGMLSFIGAVARLPTASSTINKEVDAELAAEEFLDDISANELDAAYGHTSANFRAARSRQQFQAFVDQNPRLMNLEYNTTDTQTHHPGGKLTLMATMRDSAGKPFTGSIDMVQEGTKWKVDRFTIP